MAARNLNELPENKKTANSSKTSINQVTEYRSAGAEAVTEGHNHGKISAGATLTESDEQK